MDRGAQNQKPPGGLPKPRFSLGTTNGAGRFVNRKASRNLFTGAEMNTKEETSARPQSPALPQSGRIPRAVRSVRSVSSLSTAAKSGSNGLAGTAERSGIPRLSRTPSRPDMHERPPSVASSTGSVRSDTRIPRPSLAHSQMPRTQPKRPMTLVDAWRMTEEVEELGRTSPSPAPRLAGPRQDQDECRIQKPKSQSPLDFAKKTNGTRKTSDSIRDDVSLTSSISRSSIPRPARHGDEDGEDEFDRKIKQFDKDQERKTELLGRDTGLFARRNVGERVAETGKELVKKASNSSLKENSPSRPRTWGSKAKVNGEWMRRALFSPEKEPLQERNHNSSAKGKEVESHDIPLPSVEVNPPPGTENSGFEPIKKEFTWQLDADFTEGDLQISNSPRVTFPRGQTPHFRPDSDKTDSSSRPRTSTTPNDRPGPDQEHETEMEVDFLAKSEQGPDYSPRRTNQRLDEIRKLELAAEAKIAQRVERGNRPRAKSNTKLDEVRSREADSLSKKAIASVRLNEIRARNSLSPSGSPKIPKKPSTVPMQEPTPDPTEGRRSESREERGTLIPDAPVTAYKTKPAAPSPTANNEEKRDDSKPQPRQFHRREDSRDLLRRLSRVTSNSPQDRAGEKKADKIGSPSVSAGPSDDTKPLLAARPNKAGAGDGFLNGKKAFNPKPSVGFVGLSRSESFDSIPSKRSSRSDIDPTDRIEAEMKLFAPQDNYSEKGSIRAPSPQLSDEDEFGTVEKTPRAPKPNPLTQPTPRVIGAYVDTPATVKVEKLPMEGIETAQEVETEPSPPTAGSSSRPPAPTTTHASGSTSTRSHIKHNSTSDINPGKDRSSSNVKRVGRTIQTTGGPITVRRRRARSEPRRPLVNTARIPSVRDDLLEIQRQANIEDSTLDDFDELIEQHEKVTEEYLRNNPDQSGSDDKADGEDGEMSSDVTDKMQRRLSMALSEIRSARAWATKFEDQLNEHRHTPWQRTCQYCNMEGGKPYLELPRFWPRSGHFAKGMGWAVVLLVSWLVLEANLCFFFCKPATCGPGVSCDWSPSDPSFGTAIPVKLDHWVTGGLGKKTFARITESAGDLITDIYCSYVSEGLGKSGCSYHVPDKRRIERIMKRKGEDVAGYENLSPGMYHWLQAKRAEMGESADDDDEVVVEVEPQGEEEEEDVGFISGDERL